MRPDITVEAPAKINWMLRVFDRRPDGYHDIETVLQAISLHDTLRISSSTQFSFRCDDVSIPADETNLVVRAWKILGAPPVEIELTKRIPAGGGLGGGSSDAAATLGGLAQMFDISPAGLPELALQLGSDVPFFLQGGAAYATGRGELLRKLSAAAGIPLLLAVPPERVSTSEAYRWLSEEKRQKKGIGFQRAAAIVSDGVLRHVSILTNDFEPPVFKRLPQLTLIKNQMLSAGAAWCGMSGSGSTIVGAFSDRAARDQAIAKFPGLTTIAAETI